MSTMESPQDDNDSAGEAAPTNNEGKTRISHDEAFWYRLCQKYKEYIAKHPGKHCSQRAFLRSDEADEVSGEARECRSFSRYWQRFENGELNPHSSRRRRRGVAHADIEEKLADYLNLRSHVCIRGDITGATWAKLKAKCVRWGAREAKTSKPIASKNSELAKTSTGIPANDAEDGASKPSETEATTQKESSKEQEGFRASPGWLHKVLGRNDINNKCKFSNWEPQMGLWKLFLSRNLLVSRFENLLTDLQSEMDAKEETQVLGDWVPQFHQKLVELNISGSMLYCAAQASLFYRRLPTTKAQKKANKQHVPTAERITLMVCTAADGTKVPLAAVGKPKTAFDSIGNEDENGGDSEEKEAEEQKTTKEPPIPYTCQEHAWFDQESTLWWIQNVFWPFHVAQHGDVACVLLLDHCPAHLDLAEDDSSLPSNLTIINFPINMSRSKHPGEGGVLGNLRLGFKLRLVSSVQAVFDMFGGIEAVQERFYGTDDSPKKKFGSGGLSVGDPPTLVDALELLKQVWKSSNKYVTTTLILEGWKKAKILPLWWEQEIETWIRNGTSQKTRRKEGWNDQDCVQLCHALMALASKAEETGLPRSRLETTAIKDSYVLRSQGDTFRAEMEDEIWKMAAAWIEMEDDPIVREHVVDYECERLWEKKKLLAVTQGSSGASSKSEILHRLETIQKNLAEAKEFATMVKLEEKQVRLLIRFEKNLTDFVERTWKKRVHGNTGKKRKRVILPVGDDAKPQESPPIGVVAEEGFGKPDTESPPKGKKQAI